jgi:hypothetical protein
MSGLSARGTDFSMDAELSGLVANISFREATVLEDAT